MTTPRITRPKHKPGRKPEGNKCYLVLLEPVSASWALTQPGGLSGCVRALLREEYEATERRARTAETE